MKEAERAGPDVAKTLDFVQTLAEQALSLGKPADFWPLLTQELCRFFSCERATLFQTGRQDRLVSRYAQGSAQPIAVGAEEGIAGAAARLRATVLTNDPYHDGRFSPKSDAALGFKTESLLAVPLIAQGRVAGVVELLNKPGGFRPEDAEAMEFLGAQIAAYFVLFSVEERQDQLTLQMLQMEKMAAVGRLVAGFTHEVRNPLFVIMGFADKLKEDLKGVQHPTALEDVERIRNASRRIEHLVKNLLGFSRASKATIGAIDLCGLIETTLDLVVVDSKWRRMEVVKDFDRAAPPMAGNVNTIMQVFLNLIVNAFQAMDDQGSGTLTLRVRAEGDRVVAEVQDTGPGMPEETREKLFEPFFTTKGSQGTGLGLYIVSGIVESHRGTISVASAPGKGTTFSLAFPAAR